MDDLREELAELAHEQWSGWMKYMFEKGKWNTDGTWTMPKWAVERWTRQATTKYDDLSEKEKDSDRSEADKFIAVISKMGFRRIVGNPRGVSPPGVASDH